MHIAHLSSAAALSSLRTSAHGLTRVEAERRLQEYGLNRIEKVKGDPQWRCLLREFTHFFALILWVAAGLSMFAETRSPGEGMWQLGMAILAVILINGAFSYWQEYRAERAISALRQLLPQFVKVMRDGELQTLAAEFLVPGDVVLLEEGDNVPADCRLIESAGLRVNTSTITGESLPKSRTAEAEAATDGAALDARNLLLAGTSIVSGEAQAVVFATGMHSEFGKIAHLTQAARTTVSHLQVEIARLSKLVAILATGLGLMFFLIGTLIGLPFWTNLMFAIGILVANVPEGLLPTVTLSLAMATQRMAKRNALVRHLPAVETLGSTTVICSDKTGTLTQNRMTVQQVFYSGTVRSAEAHGFDDNAIPLLRTAEYCHNLKRGNRNGQATWLGDPMEIALLTFAKGIRDFGEGTMVSEIPFDSDRRRMSVVIEHEGQRWLYCKGAPEAVLPLCVGTELDGRHDVLDDATRQRISTAQEGMADRGLRVLALAHRQLRGDAPPSESELVFSGLVGFRDPPRPEVPEAMARCHSAGIKVIMVTGDHPHTALAIARDIGLVNTENPTIIPGEALRRMTPAQVQIALDSPEILFTRVTAEQKMLVVQALKNKGEIVAVTGDGVNDAPALKAAHIGIAMGISGTDVAKEAADMVLLDDNFASIVNAIEEGRAVFENIRKFLTYILTSNIPELIPYLAFVLFRIPLPLTIIQILAVDLGTDMLPALALGAERPDPDLMKMPPRPANERLLSWPLIARAYLWLGLLQAAVAMSAFFFVLHLGHWNYGDVLDKAAPLYLQATTACLAAIVMAQMINVFVCRHPRQPALSRFTPRNNLLLLGLGVELTLILLIVYTPVGNRLFGTLAFPSTVWPVILLLALGFGAFEELRKLILRRR
ncbi:MAG: cation-transporting P-type ATPase [Propionivibrio sp.]|uniref:cation-translocating P-type ATPase n=1 Tax=Propionivibrio sp. TaxID=2212460 RepID=UPI0025ECF070|nr:cation-transporting P-type ATPase [Propionivibrio sp.]MBK8399824.1 cation-transporting P-type ATPase [Propionivibrio sp.]MBK8894698.1 cation-transporting P-type ATPase [Propionivibrio sp.]MBL0207179.1 cation-transporting P-type ATPase [Propionivibrio sp.]